MDTKEQEILQTLQADVQQWKEPLKEVVTEIIRQGYSDYPILIAHVEEMAFADKVIDREVFNSAFYYSASTLEAMVEKGIILKERKEAMEQQLKASADKVCFLLLHPEHMRFIFYPL